MTETEVKLIVGGLLHDIGKVIYRQGSDLRKHSQSGYDYLKEKADDLDKKVLDCVRYHHADALKKAKLEKNALAYIVYIADNIASAVDRREHQEGEEGFSIHTTLQPVFNILNGNQGNKYYAPSDLNIDGKINYPIDEKRIFDKSLYSKIVENISDNLKGLEWNNEYVNSLLEVLEGNLSYIPSSTSKKELPDISLYDHMKITAAICSCILKYLEEYKIDDYKQELYVAAKEFYIKKVFLMASIDISGIQNFIYTIATKSALKTLRARSFYLEILMEHIIDSLLERLHLSRANLIYSGGGHCYLLLANAESVKGIFDAYIRELNQWFMSHYKTELYIAGGYVECSSETLKNIPDGSYGELFRELSGTLSKMKSNRYTAKEIIMLNQQEKEAYTRECAVCKRVAKVKSVHEKDICSNCYAIEELSKKVLHSDFFSVIKKETDDGLRLPGGFELVADTKAALEQRMKEKGEDFIRTYVSNNMYTGKRVATKLWIGNYTTGNTFEEYADVSEGVKRIAVLRADVDNLGHAFVAGFENEQTKNRYVTLSRTATLSRQLSLFFKLHINKILKEPEFSLNGEKPKERNATIVYSGGDDLFIVGAWNEVIELAVDIQRRFAKYTENTLTLSAGIGIYHHGYPISAMAGEVADLEEESKNMPGKNAVTLFEDGETHQIIIKGEKKEISDGTYTWDEFETKVIEEKFTLIRDFFDASEDRGKAFLYHLLELLRKQEDRINFARYVYLLARMEPDQNASPEEKELYKKFSTKMYQWIDTPNSDYKANIRHLKTAINLYAYLRREKEE